MGLTVVTVREGAVECTVATRLGEVVASTVVTVPEAVVGATGALTG
ncbi:MAG: hypothetical protein AB7P49_08800 [Bdellovibrionales bacterium]